MKPEWMLANLRFGTLVAMIENTDVEAVIVSSEASLASGRLASGRAQSARLMLEIAKAIDALKKTQAFKDFVHCCRFEGAVMREDN